MKLSSRHYAARRLVVERNLECESLGAQIDAAQRLVEQWDEELGAEQRRLEAEKDAAQRKLEAEGDAAQRRLDAEGRLELAVTDAVPCRRCACNIADLARHKRPQHLEGVIVHGNFAHNLKLRARDRIGNLARRFAQAVGLRARSGGSTPMA